MTVSPALDRRFRDAAAAAGLLDAGYDLVDSPVGPLFVAATGRGLVRISYHPDPEEQLDRLARLVGPRVLRSPRQVDDARRQLDEYFAGAAARSTSTSTCAERRRSPSVCSASSPASPTARRPPTGRSPRAPARRRRRGPSGR
jgi:hypothetical protein